VGNVPLNKFDDADVGGDPTLTDAELAGVLVQAAGRLAAAMLLDGLTVNRKTSISDVVSDADKAAEAMIVGRLAIARPADGIIGEEGAAAPGRRTWVIDPVDGTYNFVSGLPAWCSALALVDGDDLLLGAIYQATTDELWVGGRDLPASLNGVALPRLTDRALAEVAISTYLHPTRVNDLPLRDGLLRSIAGAASVRIIGSGSVELAAVAAGRLGVWLHADTPSWDWLPGAALVSAAGGVIDVFEHGGHRWYVAGPPTGVAQATAAVLGTG
jgi:fructose-1,6-bisphosphatase/inositol monophosphatase family enzyme